MALKSLLCQNCHHIMLETQTKCNYCGSVIGSNNNSSSFESHNTSNTISSNVGGVSGKPLGKCPECGGVVSAAAPSCPHCGFVLKKITPEPKSISLAKKEIDVNKIINDTFSKYPLAADCAPKLFEIGEKYQNIDKSNCVRAYTLASQNYLKSGNCEMGVVASKKALELDPKHRSALINGFDSSFRLVTKYNKTEYATFCVKCAESIISYYPDDNEADCFIHNLASFYNPKGPIKGFDAVKDFNQSYKYYRTLFTKYPHHKSLGYAYNDLGVYYNDTGHYGAALAFFRLALRHTSGISESSMNLRKANYDLAYTNVKRALGHKWLDSIDTVNTFEDAEAYEDYCSTVRCPRCKSTSITTGARGVNSFWGLIGASETVNRCSNCGCTWNPAQIDWRDVFDRD